MTNQVTNLVALSLKVAFLRLLLYLVSSLEVPEDGAMVEEGQVGHVLRLLLYLVSSLEVPEDGAIVEEGQVGHVLALLKLGRVDLAQLRRLELLLLQVHKTSFISNFRPMIDQLNYLLTNQNGLLKPISQ